LEFSKFSIEPDYEDIKESIQELEETNEELNQKILKLAK
jgi:hypothetical protein